MLDIKIIREEPEKVEKNLEKRGYFKLIPLVKETKEKDEIWRKKLKELDNLRNQKNQISKQIAEAKKQGKETKELFEQAKANGEKRKKLEEEVSKLNKEIKKNLFLFPNLLDKEVPIGKSAEDNEEVYSWGKNEKREVPEHRSIAEKFGLADFKRAIKVSGAGFYFYKGDLVLLDLAIQKMAFDILQEKKYVPIIPPHFLRKEYYKGAVSLEDFENVMYSVSDDEFLIATSEHPLIAMHSGEIFEEKELPKKYAGYSWCFRKEKGRHSLDEAGFFRVHQFDKVEQVIFCKPEESKKYLREIMENAEELLKKLEIPYKVSKLCSADLGFMSSITYDIEGYSPRENKYIELMSASNLKDFQARRANIKYKEKGEKKYVHTLNSTMVALTRFFRIFLENHYKGDYIYIPKELRKYFGKDKIEAPKNVERN